jgi:hypothetical protein
MIELGIREFRKRFSELVNGDHFIIVKNNGKEVGTYMPRRARPDLAKIREAAEEIVQAQQELRDRGVDLEAEMAKLGMKPSGEPLDDE